MLAGFSFKNYRNFREAQILSLRAKPSAKERLAWNAFRTGRKDIPHVLKAAAIFGANASGKSNVIRALQVMQQCVLKNTVALPPPFQPEAFAFDEKSKFEEISFSVLFIKEGHFYSYEFSVKNHQVTHEALFLKKERKILLFERKKNDVDNTYAYNFGSSLQGQKKAWSAMTRADSLFLSTAAAFNASQLIPIVEWFANHLLIINEFNKAGSHFTIRALEQNQLDKRSLIRFLTSADINITDIQIDKGIRPGKSIFMNSNSLEFNNDSLDFCSVSVAHHENGKDYRLSLADESLGTRRLMELAGPILDAVKNNATLIVDRIEENLHPILVEKLVQSFFEKSDQADGAQLIFTTNCDSLVDNNTNDPDNPLLRRDQIWFVNKTSNNESTLYALSDYPIRKNENVRNAYLNGTFDGIPFIEAINAKS
ncbi:ATP-binding protein [uncultured Sutterella sp.]|uniref:AAA family ATPase n=1 Tax=uncultured Sutterella sp. TaxID=286133 RepID=UPI0026149FAF|nr:ATP-binding protein [uncultured Sutterella sp.]